MTEFEAASFYGVTCRFNEVTEDFVFENSLNTVPQDEIFDLDVPF